MRHPMLLKTHGLSRMYFDDRDTRRMYIDYPMITRIPFYKIRNTWIDNRL